MVSHTTRIAVVGAGPGGYAAAFLAADFGMEVVLIDPEENPGGVCLHRGCIPSKALLHVAKVITESSEAADWGVRFEKPSLDLDRIRAWKNEVVKEHTGGLGLLADKRGIRHVRGRASFADPYRLRVKLEAGGIEEVVFDHCILATGSSPARIPGLPAKPDRILDSTSALEVEPLERLLVVGGGYIGLELGTVYAALGTRVTVVEMMDSLLPGVDKDLVRPLARRAESIFENVYLSTRAAEIAVERDGVKVVFDGEAADPKEQRFDRILVAVGRKPNSHGIGLENTGIRTDEKGFVLVDAHRRTHEPTVFAIGDVAGEPMLAHKAFREGKTAVEVIAGLPAAYDPRAVPAVVFTDPEVAWCGLTESEARAEGRKVEVARFPWAASGRASTLGRHDGVTKLLVDPETERILGVGICGPGAGELIAEGVLAMEMAATVRDVDMTIHPHPTLSETVMEAAATFFGTSTHVYKPRRKKAGTAR